MFCKNNWEALRTFRDLRAELREQCIRQVQAAYKKCVQVSSFYKSKANCELHPTHLSPAVRAASASSPGMGTDLSAKILSICCSISRGNISRPS